MSLGTEFKTSAYYAELFVGVVTPFRATVWYRATNGKDEPLDLTQYDSVHLIVYNNENDVSARHDFTLTVLTADADKVANSAGTLVAARVSGNISVTGAEGAVRCKVIGKVSTTSYLLDRPWKAELFNAGPNS